MSCAFKKRVKPRALQRGDLVLKAIRGLIRDPKGKFRPNWSIPYFIRELTSEGATWLMDLNGNRFSKPINMDQLKSGALLKPFSQARIFRHSDVIMPPLLSHLVKPIFSDVVMILGCSYLKCIDSHHHFRVWSDILYVPIDFYIGAYSPFGCGDDCFLEACYIHITWSRMFIHIEGHNLDDSSPLLSFSIQSHLFNSAFRAIFLVSRFRATFSNHHQFSISLRVTISFSSFRATFSPNVEPSSLFSLKFRVTFSVSTFRAIIAFQFDIQSHHRFSVSAFRAIIAS
ncbi:hypothetical protein AAG906_040549 [Vitis piasezkii]